MTALVAAAVLLALALPAVTPLTQAWHAARDRRAAADFELLAYFQGLNLQWRIDRLMRGWHPDAHVRVADRPDVNLNEVTQWTREVGL